MSFTNNKKAKLVAAAMLDNMDYVKASKSMMSQSEFAGKKFGKKYTVYIADPGTVHQGEEASPDDINEIEVEVSLDNYNTSVNLGAWNRIADIEDFVEEIAKPRGTKLARTEEKVIIDENVFKSAQAVVSATANFKVLSDASAALRELAVSGNVSSFMSPTVMGAISNTGLANFLPNATMAEVYGKNYLGEYAGASQVAAPLFPVITTPADQSATITLVADGATGFKPIKSLATNAGVKGLAYKATGLKVVDASGMQTEQDYVIISDAEGNIPELRITIDGNGHNNPNAWVESGTDSLTLTPILDNSTSYYVGQVRTNDCLGFDGYKFEDLPGSENEAVGVAGPIAVKMSKYGNGNSLTTLVRLDAPFGAGITEHRESVTVYIKK